MVLALHSLHFRVHTRVLLTLLVACAVTSALWAESTPRQLLSEAATAQAAGQFALAREKLEAARALRPDYPRIHLQLARIHALAGESAAAFAELETLATYGLALDLGRDRSLAALTADPRWDALLRRFAANNAPQGQPRAEVVLPARTGIIEAAVRDAKGRWFFADVRNRCIWVRETDGALREFSAGGDDLLGVFSLALDETRGLLWAGVSAAPEMKNFDASAIYRPRLVAYALADGACVHSLPLPESHRSAILGSIALSADGSLYATDSAAPIIWRAQVGATEVERWLEDAAFASLQGLAFSADQRALFVADYGNGIWHIDTASKQPRLLVAPAGSTLSGIDDLRFAQGALYAVQNGLAPQRLLRIELDADGAPHRTSVLLSGHAAASDLAGGSISDGRYHVIGNSGWSLFSSSAAEPAPRDIAVLSVSL